MPSHTEIDARSLALGREVARRLRDAPELIEIARRNLERWLRADPPAPRRRSHAEWLEIVKRGDLKEICTILEGDSEDHQRLRQNSPCAGVLSPKQVRDIKRAATGSDSHAAPRS